MRWADPVYYFSPHESSMLEKWISSEAFIFLMARKKGRWGLFFISCFDIHFQLCNCYITPAAVPSLDRRSVSVWGMLLLTCCHAGLRTCVVVPAHCLQCTRRVAESCRCRNSSPPPPTPPLSPPPPPQTQQRLDIRQPRREAAAAAAVTLTAPRISPLNVEDDRSAEFPSDRNASASDRGKTFYGWTTLAQTSPSLPPSLEWFQWYRAAMESCGVEV